MDEPAAFRGAPDTRLAIYGTLAPGRVNHHQISALTGKWQRGTVKGKLMSSGWGAAVGFPGLILDPLGPSVDVHLFELNRPICLHIGARPPQECELN